MDRRRIRNLIPATYGLLIVAGFLVSATAGIIVLIVGGSVTGLLLSTLSRGGDTPAGTGRRGKRAARRAKRH